jgi:hypothetical protein
MEQTNKNPKTKETMTKEELLEIIKTLTNNVEAITQQLEKLTLLIEAKSVVIEDNTDKEQAIEKFDFSKEEDNKVSSFRLKKNNFLNADEKLIKGKYRKLSAFFHNNEHKEITLSLEKIEVIINDSLPQSAFAYREFWANSTSRPIALTWLNEGYITTIIDLIKKEITFEKQRTYQTF